MEHIELTVKSLELKSYFLLSRDDQLQLLAWRNHPSVREVFFQQTEIGTAEHLNFIESLRTDESKRYWLVSHRQEPVGSLDLYRIGSRDCYWGYFLAPHLQKSALGVLLEFAVQEVVFDRMGLTSLHCETMAHNDNALKIHRQFGFTETLRENGRVYMTQDSNTWKKKKRKLEELIELLLR